MSEHRRSKADIEAKLVALQAEYRTLQNSCRSLEPVSLADLDRRLAALDGEIATQQAELESVKGEEAEKRRRLKAEKHRFLEAELAIVRAEYRLLKATNGINEDLEGLLREYPRQDYPYLLEEIQWIKEEVGALRKEGSAQRSIDRFLFVGSPLPGRREGFAELISATLAAAPPGRSVVLRLELELIALRVENRILHDINRINDDLAALLKEQPRRDYPRLLEKIEWIRNNLAVQRQGELYRSLSREG